MEDLNDKITGDELSAAEFVQPMSEIQNIIEQSGQTLTSADVAQMLKGLTYFTTASPHFTATADGSGDLTLAPLAGRGTIYSIADGMRVRFFTTAAAVVTGAPSLTINGVTKDFRKRDGSALSTGTYAAGVWSAAEYDAGNDRWFSVEAGVGAGHGEVILAEKEDLEGHQVVSGRGARAVSVEAWKHQKKRAVLTSDFNVPGTGAVAPVRTPVPGLGITLNATGAPLTNQFYRVRYALLTQDVTSTAGDDLVLRLNFGSITEDIGRFQVDTRQIQPLGSAAIPTINYRAQQGNATAPLAYEMEFWRQSGAGGGNYSWVIEFVVNATSTVLQLDIENGSIADGTIFAGSQVTAELIS